MSRLRAVWAFTLCRIYDNVRMQSVPIGPIVAYQMKDRTLVVSLQRPQGSRQKPTIPVVRNL